MLLKEQYETVRRRSEQICAPLKTEDYVVQPVVDVSPPKWHLGHTTWFFETFILAPNAKGYTVFDPQYNYVFNSYYESVGARVIRTNRGNLSRPAVEDIMRYRKHVDEAMMAFLETPLSRKLTELFILGLNHEEQHQELLYTDIKYILGHNPLFPAYDPQHKDLTPVNNTGPAWLNIRAGMYDIGFSGDGFCFDNELGRHAVYLPEYRISTALVTNTEYLDFIQAGGYQDFRYWHAEGWDWVKNNQVTTPMYWYNIDGQWVHYTWQGLRPLMPDAPVNHISYYEAAAYAAWKGQRLPTEFEWEAAAPQLSWGQRWEWCESAYLPYPGFAKAPGAIGEYNGKFMISQMVLRGGSEVTSPNHSRITYRNFFHPSLRWQFTGIRLAG
ncbi:ergothioneine biosynthesis protein EgtB [Chitinophaga arvensicola]|uniref:Ergothioneine biosynthesis protein EgtB n=1 Tax=Chitinophaga arvensicola TaxID=29529 RepID=A0A1I0RN76_9BACT|nr:ergothioneine biosynthesis protein EgtB [Chitinophaga arvensicola]SEW41982.1 ergothioneine biosynthesis protein EgtB [Chitinophaga arvensicola]